MQFVLVGEGAYREQYTRDAATAMGLVESHDVDGLVSRIHSAREFMKQPISSASFRAGRKFSAG